MLLINREKFKLHLSVREFGREIARDQVEKQNCASGNREDKPVRNTSGVIPCGNVASHCFVSALPSARYSSKVMILIAQLSSKP